MTIPRKLFHQEKKGGAYIYFQNSRYGTKKSRQCQIKCIISTAIVCQLLQSSSLSYKSLSTPTALQSPWRSLISCLASSNCFLRASLSSMIFSVQLSRIVVISDSVFYSESLTFFGQGICDNKWENELKTSASSYHLEGSHLLATSCNCHSHCKVIL